MSFNIWIYPIVLNNKSSIYAKLSSFSTSLTKFAYMSLSHTTHFACIEYTSCVEPINRKRDGNSLIHPHSYSLNPVKYQERRFARCDDYSWCVSRHASGACRRRYSVDTWSVVPCHTRIQGAFAVRGTTCRSCDIWGTRRCRVRKNSAWCRNDVVDRSSVECFCSRHYCREL